MTEFGRVSPQRRPSTVGWLAAGCAAALLLAGCGSGAYKERMDKRIEQLGKDSPFAVLDAAHPVSGTAVTLRAPRDMKKVDVGDKGVDAQRAALSLVRPEGLREIYDGMAEVEGGQVGYALFVSVLEHGSMRMIPAPQRLQVLIDAAAESLRKRGAPVTMDRWHPEDVVSPEGQRCEWQRVTVKCPLPFYFAPDKGAGGFREAEGVVEFFVRDDQQAKCSVILVWAAPASIADPEGLNIPDLAKRVAGCVKIAK